MESVHGSGPFPMLVSSEPAKLAAAANLIKLL
jgi:hypothetical protein